MRTIYILGDTMRINAESSKVEGTLMTSTILNRIARHAESKSFNKEVSPRMKDGRHIASFLAHSEDIKIAVDAGWSLRIIWDTLRTESKITCSYRSFCEHVNKFIHGKSTQGRSINPPNTQSTTTVINESARLPQSPSSRGKQLPVRSVKETVIERPQTTVTSNKKGFKYDPNELDLKELYGS